MTGAWTARWADWVVWLQRTEAGWNVKVWHWPLDRVTERREVGTQNLLASHDEAIKWACDTMKNDGATVMVLGAPSITLESMLKFTPAPQAVA